MRTERQVPPWGHWRGSGPFADHLPFSTSSPHPLDHLPQKRLALEALLLGKQNRDTVFRPFAICCQDEERQSQALLGNFTNPRHNALVRSPYVVMGFFMSQPTSASIAPHTSCATDRRTCTLAPSQAPHVHTPGFRFLYQETSFPQHLCLYKFYPSFMNFPAGSCF